MIRQKLKENYRDKSDGSRSKGVLETTTNTTLPKWNLSSDLKDAKETPTWIYDKEFEKARDEEIEVYSKISEKIKQLSEIGSNPN